MFGRTDADRENLRELGDSRGESLSTIQANQKGEHTLNNLDLAHTVVDILEEKKGEDILLLDIRELTPIADYFVICSGSSDRMLDALVEAVKRGVRSEYHIRPRVEGDPQTGWMLADYGGVVVHLFSPDRRAFYRLEELWQDGKVILHLQ